MPHLEKFSEKSWRALSSRNLTWSGVESEEDALEQRGFQDGTDLRLSAMRRLFEREGERERETNRKAPINSYTKKRENNGMYA